MAEPAVAPMAEATCVAGHNMLGKQSSLGRQFEVVVPGRQRRRQARASRMVVPQEEVGNVSSSC